MKFQNARGMLKSKSNIEYAGQKLSHFLVIRHFSWSKRKLFEDLISNQFYIVIALKTKISKTTEFKMTVVKRTNKRLL